MKHSIIGGFLIATLAFGQSKPGVVFKGVITDSMCAGVDHARMGMGPTDAACTKACIEAHGAEYVLYDGNGKVTYYLSDQKTPEKFAGQKVSVAGKLDPKSKTIQVDSITASK